MIYALANLGSGTVLKLYPEGDMHKVERNNGYTWEKPGWSDGTLSLVTIVKDVTPTPAGKRIAGRNHVVDGGEVKEVLIFENIPPPTAEETRVASFVEAPDRADLFTRLKTATPAQVDTWIDNNVTSLAAARAVLKAIVKYLVATV
jgi:hypothetical protein